MYCDRLLLKEMELNQRRPCCGVISGRIFKVHAPTSPPTQSIKQSHQSSILKIECFGIKNNILTLQEDKRPTFLFKDFMRQGVNLVC